MHFSGSCKAMARSTPEMGGPFTSTQRQGWPRALMEAQQASVGGMGLKGATAALQGMSWTRAEKNVLPQGWPELSCTEAAITATAIIKQASFILEFTMSPFFRCLISRRFVQMAQPFIASRSWKGCLCMPSGASVLIPLHASFVKFEATGIIRMSCVFCLFQCYKV